jgi:uncharacterized membrane protein YdbT with pleckstrin-like domain
MNTYFREILDTNETITWTGKPVFLPFLATGIPFLIFGAIWGIMDYGFIAAFLSGNFSSTPFNFTLIPFFLLHLAPLWLSILNILRLVLSYNNTAYAFTNKRVIMRTGFWGTDFKSVDYDKISDIKVNVNPLENLFGVGTIWINSGLTNSKGASVYDSITAISKPYEAYKKLKTVSVDIKTDWNYPNKLRPTENPGYNTTYVDKH